jgi:quercetin dioxygenase-like cupin family protein
MRRTLAPYSVAARGFCRLVKHSVSVAAIAVVMLATAAKMVQAEIEAPPCHPMLAGKAPGFGCIVLARKDLGALTRTPLFWYIDVFPTVAAANLAKETGGTVVGSRGKVWLFTIARPGWKSHGHRVARIGPLPLASAKRYAIEYVEGDFPPGMVTRVHRHPGVEAFYTFAGETCLETPNGRVLQRAGDPGFMVPGGTPMKLTATGTTVRHGFAAVLEDASKPFSTVALDWKPRGLCTTKKLT